MEEKRAVEALSALAQESRLRVFRLLVKAGLNGMAAGAIAEELGVPPATLSFHLAQLTRAGLARTRRVGRSIIYALERDGIRTLLGFLMEDCCGGRPELCSPMPSVPVPLTRPRNVRKERA
jgi:ArsR family transcriptional regulator, arsenate/arsenite/antimonite-responsive transcriptional repressor